MRPAKGRGGGGPGAGVDQGEEAVVVVRWPELQTRLARAGCRAAELAAAAEARAALVRRLEAALQVRRESLRQGAALDEMRRRLELRRRRAEEAVVGKRRALVAVDRHREQLQAQIERVLPLSRALASVHHQVQEANEVLCAEKKRLEDLQRLLRMRQQCMISQVAALYPVRVFHDLLQPENHDANCNGENGTLSGENGNGTHVSSVIQSPQVRPLMFLGWQITKHKRKQKSYSDKELMRSAAVLGYSAHAVLLIASYLDVPLRYPLHFGGSRSYVSDRLPSAETAPVASAEHPSADSPDSELTEYPLFQERQEDDSTKASYAIYLLYKDTEQLLNYIGVESTGRYVFGNLQELIRIIQSDEFVYI